MNELLNYILEPSTVISIVSAIIAWVIAWTSLKWRVDRLEEKVNSIEALKLDAKIDEINTKLAEIQTDLKRLMKGGKN